MHHQPNVQRQQKPRRALLLALAVVAILVVTLAACQAVFIPVDFDGMAAAGATSPQGAAAPVDPTVDRVGFPTGWEDFSIFYEFDRPDNKTARVIYANDVAAAVTPEELAAASIEPGQPFPYGSVLVMAVYRTQRDEGDNVLLDENGRFVREELSGLFVMRKEPGFGAKYGHQRNGEWEYAAYRPDGSTLTPPERTTACAACHVEAGQGRDWVFGAHRAFPGDPPVAGENEVILNDYTFMPGVITTTVGSEITWTNQDVVFHTVTAADWAFGSGMLRPDASFRHTFELPGEYAYVCAVHPSMRGVVVVEEGE